jgi:very-short-patch-repair endonuclease
MLHAPTPSEEGRCAVARWGSHSSGKVVLGERYIADFFAPSLGVVVEVNGGAHSNSRASDRRKDEKLRRLGYRVVRVEAALVMRDVAVALAVIRAALT